MHTPGRHSWVRQGVGLDRRLDKMVANGRLTEDEAERLRSATSPDEREEVGRAIQLRHVRARIDEAVEGGQLTEADAHSFIERAERGEDLRFLRGLGRRRRAD